MKKSFWFKILALTSAISITSYLVYKEQDYSSKKLESKTAKNLAKEKRSRLAKPIETTVKNKPKAIEYDEVSDFASIHTSKSGTLSTKVFAEEMAAGRSRYKEKGIAYKFIDQKDFDQTSTLIINDLKKKILKQLLITTKTHIDIDLLTLSQKELRFLCTGFFVESSHPKAESIHESIKNNPPMEVHYQFEGEKMTAIEIDPLKPEQKKKLYHLLSKMLSAKK